MLLIHRLEQSGIVLVRLLKLIRSHLSCSQHGYAGLRIMLLRLWKRNRCHLLRSLGYEARPEREMYYTYIIYFCSPAIYPLSYSLKYTPFRQILKQCDCGIIVSVYLAWFENYSFTCSSAYHTLNVMRRTIPLSSTILRKRHVSYTSQILNVILRSQILSLRFIRDVLCLEMSQLQATK